ncbi:hypothetical protein AtDm6_1392 [Acetobacter tropicalis]|uniref:Uncharacterized protein n=1 Tax=Acetobacter tropicalis TaxID=104102 RepID=A0A094ZNZ4_9PROT|nr:hypothetical protein AtDm6_1392 [Acetobacter tropicalis]
MSDSSLLPANPVLAASCCVIPEQNAEHCFFHPTPVCRMPCLPLSGQKGRWCATCGYRFVSHSCPHIRFSSAGGLSPPAAL